MNVIRHLFWDFDGTLYDTYPQMTNTMLETLGEMKLPLPSAEEALGLLKRSVYCAASHYAALYKADVKRVMDVFHKHHQQTNVFVPYPGLENCLRRLHEAGIRHYLYTHRDGVALKRLEMDGLSRFFTDAVTRLDGFADKPAPDALNALMARNGVKPNEAAMVGDRDIDIEAGHNAHMAGILFDPDGFYPNVTAQMRVNTLDELCQRLLL